MEKNVEIVQNMLKLENKVNERVFHVIKTLVFRHHETDKIIYLRLFFQGEDWMTKQWKMENKVCAKYIYGDEKYVLRDKIQYALLHQVYWGW